MNRRFCVLRRAGLFSVIASVLAFGQGPAQAPKQSVKPGINDTWKSDNVAPLVAMLDSESREIYHQREKLAALVGLKPGMAIADVGAGSGFMIELFAKAVGPAGKAYAVDINAKLLERIAQQANTQGLKNLETILAKDDSANLPAKSVDVVFLCDTYHHFEYPADTMASIHRALRPGGQLIIVEFVMTGATGERMRNHVRGGQDVFTSEIVAAGFELTKVHDVPWLTENYILRFRKGERPNAKAVSGIFRLARGESRDRVQTVRPCNSGLVPTRRDARGCCGR